MRVAYRYIWPLTVVYARSIGPYTTSVREAWSTLGRWLEERKMRRAVRRGLGFFRDDPSVTPADLLRYDACVDVLPGLDADPKAGIGRQVLAAGHYAIHTQVGSYDNTGQLLSQLRREEVPRHGFTVDCDRPFIAIYLNDPQITPEVHRRTELCIPVLPLRMPASGNDNSERDLIINANILRPDRL